MSDPQSDKQMNLGLFWALFVLLLGFAAFIRFYDLNADPPAFFARGSQDLTTDGAYLTLHAKQAVLFGQWDLFGFKHWAAFKVSIVSGVSYLLFELFGVSRATANAAGGLLSLGGILLFITAPWRHKSRRFILILTLFLSSSFVLTTYGRLPFLENGLLFLGALLFFVYSRWFESVWGKIAMGVLIAFCGLLGKGFGFVLGAGPLVYMLRSGSKSRHKDLTFLMVPLAATFALFWALFYQDQGFFTFLWEHGAGVHGFPHGFSSPTGFFEALISYDQYGLHMYSAVVSLVCYLCFVTLLIGRWKVPSADKTMIFMLGWFVAWILGLAPFNYLPLRYLFLLLVPMSTVAALYLDHAQETAIGGFEKPVWWRLSLLLLINWVLLFNLCGHLIITQEIRSEYFRTVWLVLPFAMILTLAMILVLRRRLIAVSKRAALIIVVVVVAGAILLEGFHQSRWISQRLYTIFYGNRDLSALLDPKAVVAGQAGPAFTADSKIRNFPLFVSPDVADLRKKLEQYPITHLVLGDADWETLVTVDPSFGRGRPLTRFWVRDNVYVLVRVAGVVKNSQSDGYVLSDYEKADLAMVQNQSDSNEFYLRRFVAAHPDCRAGLSDLYYNSLQHKSLENQRPLVDHIVTVLPTDFAACLLGAIYYKWLYSVNHSDEDRSQSEELLKRAIWLNRENEENIRRLYRTCQPQDRVL